MFQPKYQITDKTLNNVARIEGARELINTVPLVPVWEERFRRAATLKTVHHGTHVEGNGLSLGEVEKLLDSYLGRDDLAEMVGKKARVIGSARDIQEVLNYGNVLEFVFELVNLGGESLVYRQEELMQIHSVCMEKVLEPDEVGVYRRQQIVVRGVSEGEIVHRPPNAVEIPYQIEDFFMWLNSEGAGLIHPVLKAAIAHYELSRIYPFSEGSGKTARAFVFYILVKEGVDKRRFFSIEEHFDRNILEYYGAQRMVEERGGDMTYWIEYFSTALSREMEKVKQEVKKLSMDSKVMGRMGKKVALKERQIRLMEFLETHSVMTMAEAREVLPMVSDDTILRDLRDLMRKKLVKKEGKTKGARYVLRV